MARNKIQIAPFFNEYRILFNSEIEKIFTDIHIYWREFWMDLPKEVKVIYGVDAHSVDEMEANYRIQKDLHWEK